MDCHKIQNKFSLYLQNELSAREQHKITAHLVMCEQCRSSLQQLKAVLSLVGDNKPAVRMPYASEVFLLQLRRKIKQSAIITPKRSLLPKLMPALTSGLLILIAIVFFATQHSKTASDTIVWSDMSSADNSVSELMNELDQTAQDLVAEQMFEGISGANFIDLESALDADADYDELLASLNSQEQEFLMNQMLIQYEEAKVEINPDWLPLLPVNSEPTSLGG